VANPGRVKLYGRFEGRDDGPAIGTVWFVLDGHLYPAVVDRLRTGGGHGGPAAGERAFDFQREIPDDEFGRASGRLSLALVTRDGSAYWPTAARGEALHGAPAGDASGWSAPDGASRP
jgi:hypothetical protein